MCIRDRYASAASLLRILFGSLPERLGPKRVLFPAVASMAIGYATLAGAQTSGAVLSAGILCGIGHGFTFPILAGLVVTRARAAERGVALAIFTALFDLGVLIGGPLLGTVAQSAGYSAMFYTSMTLVLIGAVVFGIWDRLPASASAARG